MSLQRGERGKNRKKNKEKNPKNPTTSWHPGDFTTKDATVLCALCNGFKEAVTEHKWRDEHGRAFQKWR